LITWDIAPWRSGSKSLSSQRWKRYGALFRIISRDGGIDDFLVLAIAVVCGIVFVGALGATLDLILCGILVGDYLELLPIYEFHCFGLNVIYGVVFGVWWGWFPLGTQHFQLR
jgi:hypothetical protein